MPSFGRDGLRSTPDVNDTMRGDIERGGYESPQVNRSGAAGIRNFKDASGADDDEDDATRGEKRKWLNPSTMSLTEETGASPYADSASQNPFSASGDTFTSTS